MKQISILSLLLLCCSLTAANPPEADPGEKLILSGVRVFDVRSGEFTRPLNIYIDGDKIHLVGMLFDAPFDGRTIDCSGKFAIPGLFDCHTHLANLTTGGEDSTAISLADFVRQGVMYVRDVGGPIDVVSEMNRRISAGELLGPEMFYTGPMLEKSPLTWADQNEELPDFTVAVDSIDDVDSLLFDLAHKGAHLVKTFSKMDTVVYRHLVDVAHQCSLRVVHDPGGPLFHAIPMDWAMELGVTSIEHAKAPWPVVLNDTLLEEYTQLMSLPPDPMTSRMFMTKTAGAGVESVSMERLKALAQTMKEKQVFLCPTLNVLENIEEMAIESTKEAMQLEELPPPMLMMIKATIAGMDAVSRLFVKTLSAEGVKMFVGQDGGDPSGTTGEMRFMRECGVGEAEIIKGATIYPAQWLGVDDRLGEIAPRKEASMVILDANPLEDIGNMEAVSFVVRKGVVLER